MRSLFIIGAIGLLSYASTAHGEPGACLAGMRNALIKGHFSGPIICSKTHAKFAFVGRTVGKTYSIFAYRYRYLPHKGGVMHGGQKIVVFSHGKYIGQYTLSPPPFSMVLVSGNDVIVTNEKNREKQVLNFSKGPQRKAFLNGDMVTFYR